MSGFMVQMMKQNRSWEEIEVGRVEGRRSSIRIKSPAAVHVLPYRDSIIQYMFLDDSRIVLLDCNWTLFVMRAKVSRLWQIFLGVPLNYQRVGRTEYTVD